MLGSFGAVVSLLLNWGDLPGWLRWVYVGLLILHPWAAATIRTAFVDELRESGVTEASDKYAKILAIEEAIVEEIVEEAIVEEIIEEEIIEEEIMEEMAEELPTTAGPLPWLALFGSLFLILGGALRFSRKQ